jgi:beta-ureidopropionase
MNDPEIQRREFLRRTAIGAGLGTASVYAASGTAAAAEYALPESRLPREVWIAAFSQTDITADDPAGMARQVLAQMEKITSLQPDVVCLPETVLFTRVRNLPSPAEAATISPELSRPFAEFARRNRCHVVFPTYTREGERVYNASLIFDRRGELLGEYRKIRPAEDEMRAGITPGPADPPVFHTDFGVIGAQICFDIEWSDGWRKLRRQGAEIVFWSSAFAGGAMVNTAAWQHKVAVVSSTRRDTTRICDISGEELARTGRWSPNWAVAPVNLEKVFLHTWPYNRHFDAIRAKYGRRVRITNFDEEEWTIIESRSPDLRVAEVMNEFGLKSHEETMEGAERMHQSAWYGHL